MKKFGFLTGLLLMASLTFAQVHKLNETTVEPPKFVGQQIVDSKSNSTSSPICNYLKTNLQNHSYIKEGVVSVIFSINPDGTLSNFSINNSVDEANDKAVIDCLKHTSGLWQAGLVNGQPVEMEKEIYVHFVNSESNSLEEMAQENIMAAVSKYESAKNVKKSVKISSVKAQKRATKKFQSALSYLNEANKYQPEEPAVVFWQACTYEELGNELKKTEKLNEFLDMIDLQYQAQIESVNILVN